MKKLFTLIVLTFSLQVFASSFEVSIEGMTCGMCVESITKELNSTGKLKDVKVSLEEKMARFSEMGEKKISDQEIKKAVSKAGYTAKKISKK